MSDLAYPDQPWDGMLPRRPTSIPERPKRNVPDRVQVPPPFLPPRRPSASNLVQTKPANTSRYSPPSSSRTSLSRTNSLQTIPDVEPSPLATNDVQRSTSDRRRRLSKLPPRVSQDRPWDQRLRAIQDGQPLPRDRRAPVSRVPSMKQQSSLRVESRLSEDGQTLLTVHPAILASAHSDPTLIRSDLPRPHSHPPARTLTRSFSSNALGASTRPPTTYGYVDPWAPAPLPLGLPAVARSLMPRPRASFHRLSSLDNLITYREEVAEWKRESSVLDQRQSDGKPSAECDPNPALISVDDQRAPETFNEKTVSSITGSDIMPSPKERNRFRTLAGELGFCFTIAMTQFLAEYLISGFAIALPQLLDRVDMLEIGPGTLGVFWPASLLSLILSASLLVFARLADIYGGYGLFMAGLLWLGVWTLIPGFFVSESILDVSRAMQGLAIAAFMPSTFVMVSTFYEEGPRKNFVLGLYSGCAPLGFFAGFLVGSTLPDHQSRWYLWIASIMAFTTTITAYLTIPHDWTDRKQLGLKMDWLGSFLITASLILVNYALAYEPSANMMVDHSRSGFSFPPVYGPFVAGVLCLAVAVWVEGWYAKCPLLPFDFFRPKGMIVFCLAALCFYASYGVWLYESSEFFESGTGTTRYADGVTGVQLAIWYIPTAIGGLILCIIGGSVIHIVPMQLLLLLSGFAWIAAPLLLALCPLHVSYWKYVLPSMLCATLGIDLTYTVSLVYFSETQPKKYQGLCGAVASILVNLAMSFSLPISEIVEMKALMSIDCSGIDARTNLAAARACSDAAINWSYRAMFIYAAASACLGLICCLVFIWIRSQRKAWCKKPMDEETGAHDTSSEASNAEDDTAQRPSHQDETAAG